MAKGEKVLIYNINSASPKGVKLRNTLRVCGTACQTLTAEDSGQTIGYLLRLDGFAQNQPSDSYAEGEALIFYNFTKQRLDRLLAALKRAGIIIPLKAVVTEHNINWTITALIGELEQEHRLMSTWQRLSACVKRYKGGDKELVKEAKALLSSHAPDIQALEETLALFEKHS